MNSPPARTFAWLTLGIPSYLYRTAPVARAAMERGHRFVLVTADADGAALARHLGIETMELAAQGAAWAATFPGPSWRHGGRLLGRVPGVRQGPRRAAREIAQRRRSVLLDGRELLDVVASLDPDLVVTELEQHRDIRLMLGAGRPLVLIDDLYGTLPGPDAPHAGSGLHPTGTVWSRRRVALDWWKLYRRLDASSLLERRWLEGADNASVLAELTRREGIDPNRIGRGGYMFHDYPGLVRIRPISPLLLLPGDDRSGVITGPAVDGDRVVDIDPADLARWEAIADRRRRARTPSATRLVFASIGTLSDRQDDFVTAIVEALGGRSDLEIVMAIGRDADRWRDRSVPANVHLFARLPQPQVLAVADLMIGQAGVGSVHEALWAGVPQILVPVGGIGQAGLAVRVDHAKLGRHLPRRRLRADRLAALADGVLADEVMQARVATASATMRAGDGAGALVDALEASAAHRR